MEEIFLAWFLLVLAIEFHTHGAQPQRTSCECVREGRHTQAASTPFHFFLFVPSRHYRRRAWDLRSGCCRPPCLQNALWNSNPFSHLANGTWPPSFPALILRIFFVFSHLSKDHRRFLLTLHYEAFWKWHRFCTVIFRFLSNWFLRNYPHLSDKCWSVEQTWDDTSTQRLII